MVTPTELEKLGYRVRMLAGSFEVERIERETGRYVRIPGGPAFKPKTSAVKFRKRHPAKYAALLEEAWAVAATHYVTRRLSK